MKIIVNKEDLLNGIRIVERATSQKAVQPVLYNILFETLENNQIRLSATDLVLTVITTLDVQIQEPGKITLPAKKLNEIVSKLGNDLVTIDADQENSNVTITCQKSKFDIIGISANEFPADIFNYEMDPNQCFDVELAPFLKGIRQAGFAAASYEVSNLLSGIVCDFNNGILEIASTDGNRLARVRESISSSVKEQTQLIIPSRTLNEFLKMSSFIDEDSVKICKDKSTIIFQSEKITTISRLLEGQFPRYNQLIPSESPKKAVVNVSQLIAALERVSVMVNDKTLTVKMHFADNELTLSANTPEAGKSEDTIDIEYTSEELLIAFNYRFVLEALKIIESDEVVIGLNAPLSATVIKPNNDEDFICLVMPVQIR